jgi:hypothetical protein
MDVSDQELKLRLRLAQIEKNEACQEDFLVFVKNMWPEFIAGRHHKIIAEKLERVAKGELKRLDHQYGTAAHQVGVCVFLVSCMDDGPQP